MTNNQRFQLGVGVCAAAVLGGWWYTHSDTAKQYKTEEAQRGRIQATVSVTGTCSALLTVQVGSQVSGIVKALYADFNSQVHKGQPLAQIDPLPFQERLNQAQAAVESARAAVAAAKATVEKAEIDIQTARTTADSERALLEQARAGEREAKGTADRQQKLAADSIVSDDQFQSAEAIYQIAVADREAVDAQEHVAETTIDEMREAKDAAVTLKTSAEAQVRQAEGALQQAKLDLDHTRITSPIDGVVVSRDVDAGQTVASNFAAPELFRIAEDLSKMQADADIDEADVAQVHAGQVAQFTVDAMPNRTFEAVQVRMSATNIQNVITYDAVMDVPNPDLELLPGMTANIRIPVQVRENALRVSNNALRFRPDDNKPVQPAVYVLNTDGMLEARKVQLGISDGIFTEVVSGDLRDGEAVILSEARGRQ